MRGASVQRNMCPARRSIHRRLAAVGRI